jgi:hypothetical protein
MYMRMAVGRPSPGGKKADRRTIHKAETGI